MFLLKDTTQWRRWGSTHSSSVSSQALYHWATALPVMMTVNQAPKEECVIQNLFSYLTIKTYVVGTQKNLLNEKVLLSTQNKC